jgi:hypothetical protein
MRQVVLFDGTQIGNKMFTAPVYLGERLVGYNVSWDASSSGDTVCHYTIGQQDQNGQFNVPKYVTGSTNSNPIFVEDTLLGAGGPDGDIRTFGEGNEQCVPWAPTLGNIAVLCSFVGAGGPRTGRFELYLERFA